MRQIVLDWTERGIRGVRGNSWSIPALRNIVCNPRIAGYAVFRGELVRDPQGIPLRLHEPVIDQQTWDLLASRFAQGPKKRRAATDSMLRGLLRCGRCGSGMMFANNKWGGAYACWRNASAASGCIGNYVSARRTDELIESRTTAILSEPALLEPILGSLQAEPVDATPLHNEIAGLQQALTKADLDKAKGAYEDDDGERRHAEVKRSLLAELDNVRRALRRLTAQGARRAHPLLAPDGSNVITALQGLTKQEKRTVLLELIDEITIAPTARTEARNRKTTGGKFDESRVRVTWRSAEAVE
jgi:hypothetical protein